MYGALQDAARPRLVIDKSPSYAEQPATLRRMDAWFSSTYLLVLVRHPFAVMESYVRNRIGAMASERRGDAWEQAEHHWVSHYRAIARFLDDAPRPAHVIRYEDLVAAPEPALRAICASLGIGFDPAVLRPYEGPRMRMLDGVGDPNLHEHSTIEAALGDAWRHARPPRPLGRDARALAERFGYELELA